MGQTLSHGVYLPAEGERNCYSGLASNWNLLDTAIGDTAGKASATHTHGNISSDGKVGTTANLPLITGTGGAIQAGSFGNAANTFCEGNDSRLSDARTPVAHTHTKSDVTDLFNSANTWTKNQVIASSNDQCYYVKDTVYELGQNYPSGEHLGGLSIQDKNGATVGLIDIVDRSYGNMEMRIRVQQKFDPNSNNRSTSGNILYNEMALGITSTKTNYLEFNADLWGGNTYNLGTASSKWKTLNGINPGALSIFNPSATQDPIDIPNTWATDGSAWNPLNVSNMGDGWICLTYRLCGPNDYILARFGGTNANTYPSMIFPATRLADSGYFVYALMPVAKAMGNIYLEIKLDSNAILVKHSFIPAYGTV